MLIEFIGGPADGRRINIVQGRQEHRERDRAGRIHRYLLCELATIGSPIGSMKVCYVYAGLATWIEQRQRKG